MPQYGRRIIVQVARLLITDPQRIAATATLNSGDTQDSGTVRIWNLSRANERLISERAEQISVEAGYEGQVAHLFSGQVQEIRRVRQYGAGVARIVNIEVGDIAHSAPSVRRTASYGGVTARTWGGPVAIAALTAQLAADAGLAVGAVDAIPAGATASDFTWTGRSTDALTSLLSRVGCSWYEDDGLLIVRRKGSPAQSGARRWLITPETGLIGSPTETDEGAEISMLLNPNVRRGDQFTVQSDLLSGDYTGVALAHNADNRQGRFRTWADLRPHNPSYTPPENSALTPIIQAARG